MSRKRSDDEEIKHLLNIKLDTLGDLDLLEDEKKREKQEKPPEKRQEISVLEASPQVARIEKKLEAGFDDQPGGSPLLSQIKQMSFKDRNAEYLQDTHRAYEAALHSTEKLYRQLAFGSNTTRHDIESLVNDIIRILKQDQCILVNFSSFDSEPENHLFHHALNSCLMSVNIGTMMNFSEKQILEIGQASLLADVGMLLVPEAIVKKPGKLTEEEYYEILKHPMNGVQILDKVLGLADQISFVSYQHHERLTGKGYPKSRHSRLIHSYSRISAIADIFEALTSARPYRPAMHPYYAMHQVLKMGTIKLLDLDILRRILPLTSIYPVGCLVELSNGYIAKVVQANGATAVSKPIVTTLIDPDGRYMERGDMFQVDLLKDKEITIVNPAEFRDYPGLEITDGF